jgi:hypothetical protein
VLAWPVISGLGIAVSVAITIGLIIMTLTLWLYQLQERHSAWFGHGLLGVRRFFQASLLTSLIVLLVPMPLWYVGFVSGALLVSGIVLVWFSIPPALTSAEALVSPPARFGWLIMSGILLVIAGLYAVNLSGYGFQMDELYGAREVKTFFADGKLFYLEDTYYGRSEVTTLIGIAAAALADRWPGVISLEDALRIPMLVLSVFGVWLFYVLLRRFTSEVVAISGAAFVGLETYLVYFATYYRFYAISTFFLALTFYVLIRYSSRHVALVSAVIWAFGYFVLTEYCLLISAFLLAWYLLRLWSQRHQVSRVEWLLAGGGVVLCPVVAAIGLLGRIESGSVYSLLALEFNPGAMVLMGRWLFINYAPFLVTAVLGAVSLGMVWWRHGSRALPVWSILVMFVWANILFLFGYIVHASFNFTFRVTLFFLPALFVVLFVVLRESMRFSERFIAAVAVVSIGSVLAASFWYRTDAPGDRFFPTKLLYEKQPIVVANDAVARYLNATIHPQYPAVIGYLGLGIDDVRYYADTHVAQRLVGDFRYRRVGNSSLSDLEQFLRDHERQDVYMVVAANAQPEVPNHLQALVFERPTALEVNYDLVAAVRENPDFRLVYRAPDGYTTIYLRTGQLAESDSPSR